MKTLAGALALVFVGLLAIGGIMNLVAYMVAAGDGYPIHYEQHESLAYGRTMVFVGENADGDQLCFVTAGGQGGNLRLGCIPEADILGGWTPEMGSHVLVAADPNGGEGFLLVPMERG